jgi:hypothetical protein
MSNATRILFALVIGLVGGVLVGKFAPIATNAPAYWADYSLDIIIPECVCCGRSLNDLINGPNN